MTIEPVVFFGTPATAVGCLDALLAAEADVRLVVTQPDRRRGRGGAVVPSPVKQAAVDHGLTVRTPDRAREVVDELRTSGATRGVVVAFGQLLPDEVLTAFPNGLVNVHYSLLPRWRGAAPVERAILAGDTETGVSVMEVAPELDTGAVYARRVIPIGADETAGELHERLAAAGATLLVETLERIDDLTPEPQAGDTVYAVKLTTEEFRLDLTRPAAEQVRVVRAGNPRPGAWLEVDGSRLKVWQAHEESGRFVPDEVQPEGKRPMPTAAWRAGHRGADPFT